MKHQSHNTKLSTTPSVKSAVLEQIQKRQIRPTGRWYFFCGECVTILLWGVSVLLGAVAVAIIAYVGEHSAFALVEATHTSYFAYLTDIVPVLWVVVFVGMAVAAYSNFRHIKTGYRYSVVTIVGSSVAASALLGGVLHVAGLGMYLDTTLARLPLYPSLEKKELALWLQPNEGRLVGMTTADIATSTAPVTFTAADDSRWTLETAELQPPDRQILASQERVRVVGFVADGVSTRRFIACGVFPWLYTSDVTLPELAAERRAFIERMYAHKDATATRTQAIEEFAFASTRPQSRCAEHAVTKRIERQMR